MARNRTRYTGRKVTGKFFMVPRAVLESPSYRGVSSHAAKLLLDLGAQYGGHNNGDQCAAWTLMEVQGWRSRDTLCKAKRQLVEAGLIEQTRQGGLNVATLFAFTWLPIDECGGKLDVPASKVASGKWKGLPSASNGTSPNTPAVSG